MSEAISAGSENADTKFPDVAFAHPGYGDDETPCAKPPHSVTVILQRINSPASAP
jgi:hypothetical protein